MKFAAIREVCLLIFYKYYYIPLTDVEVART